MGSRDATRRFVLFLLSVSAVRGEEARGEEDWGVECGPAQICAVKGSTVEIHCSYRHPPTATVVQQRFWFIREWARDPTDLRASFEYAGRMAYRCETSRCTLTITDLRETDSAVYQFRFTTNRTGGSFTGSPGVALSVTGVEVRRTEPRLECHTSCLPTPSPSYIWYKNGQPLPRRTFDNPDRFYHSDTISCAVRDHEDSPSAPVCYREKSCDSLSYGERNICAFRGSSVDISCSYSYNSYSYSYSYSYYKTKHWFVAERQGVRLYSPQNVNILSKPEFRGRVQVSEPGAQLSTLRISDLRLTDSAQYRFSIKSYGSDWLWRIPGTTLTVTEPDVRVVWSPVGPALTCHSSCLLSGRSSFVWYKNGTEVPGETSPALREFLLPENNYSCAYQGHHSAPVYAPKVPLVRLSPPGDILNGSQVSLTCSSDADPRPAYQWFKNNQALTNRAGEGLEFTSIRFSDSGHYHCAAENDLGRTASPRFLVDVKYAPQSATVSASPPGEMLEGGSVTLTCSSDANPPARYTWYKENRTLPLGHGDVYRLSSVGTGDSGLYSCTSENPLGRINSKPLHIDVQYPPRRPSVWTSPPGEMAEGGSVTLTCSSDANPAANYTWYKEDSPKASGRNFTVALITADHGGHYRCEAQNARGRSNATFQLTVRAGAWKSAVTGTMSALLLVVVLLAVFLWIRGHRSSTQQPACGETPEDRAQISAAARSRVDVDYVSVRFSQDQAYAIYSNISRVQPQRERESEAGEAAAAEEEVEYSAVRFAAGTRRPEDGDYSSAVYTTVNKS